jgi:thioesterase domain-containing protein
LLIPGYGGSLMHLFDIAKDFDSSFPVYGLQPPGMDGIGDPFETIEDLASYYLDALRRLPQQRPYILIGHSIGGLVALEIAQRLKRSVALLALVESYPHRRDALRGRFVKSRVGRAVWRISFAIHGRLAAKKHSFEPQLHCVEKPWASSRFAPIMERAFLAEYRSWQKYRPRHYRGRIHLVKNAHNNTQRWLDPRCVWADFADDLILDTAPEHPAGTSGRRHTGLGTVLSKRLRESLQPLMTITTDTSVVPALPQRSPAYADGRTGWH